MAEAIDHHIPVSVILSRLEKHRDELREERKRIPWWQWKKRYMLIGATAAYDYEIEQLLGITSRWQPFWQNFKANPS